MDILLDNHRDIDRDRSLDKVCSIMYNYKFLDKGKDLLCGDSLKLG